MNELKWTGLLHKIHKKNIMKRTTNNSENPMQVNSTETRARANKYPRYQRIQSKLKALRTRMPTNKHANKRYAELFPVTRRKTSNHKSHSPKKRCSLFIYFLSYTRVVDCRYTPRRQADRCAPPYKPKL